MHIQIVQFKLDGAYDAAFQELSTRPTPTEAAVEADLDWTDRGD